MYTPPFTVTDEILSLVSEISEAIGSLNILMGDNIPHPMLRKQNRIKTIQSSLAIENNSLSLEQVTAIVEGKRVFGPPNEIQEVKGAINAYDILLQVNPYKEKDLLKAHKLMMDGLVRENGRYRSGGVGVFSEQGCVHLAPPAMRVPILMNDLFEWVKSTKTHPLVSSCVFHYEFEFIHPFADGNGRMGRMWQTALLTHWKPVFAWLPVETIVKEHQQDYYDAIAKSDNEANSTAFITFMLRCIQQSIKDVATPKTTSKTTPKDMIIAMMKENPKVTVVEIANAIGMNKRNAQNHINALSAEGKIKHVGASRGGHWEVIGK